MPHFVYILKCSDGSYYTGSTSDIHKRISEHENGVDRKSYTYSRRPVELVWRGEFETKDQAFSFERQVKGWNRKKKEALMAGNLDRLPELSRSNSSKRAD